MADLNEMRKRFQEQKAQTQTAETNNDTASSIIEETKEILHHANKVRRLLAARFLGPKDKE